MTGAKEGTEATINTITNTRTIQDIIMDGTRARGIRTATATNIAGPTATGIEITIGIVIAITAGNIIGTVLTKGVITASASWKSTSITTIPNVTVTMTTAPALLSC